MNSSPKVSFDNIENAFAGKSKTDLNRAYLLFKAINNNMLVGMMEPLVKFSVGMHLPINSFVKATIFRQFVGGESIETCEETINRLFHHGVGSILDYSVEGKDTEESFNNTAQEIINTIEKAKGNPKIPFCVFKVTGIASARILEKVSSKSILDVTDQKEWEYVAKRVNHICETAANNNVRIFIDAEESWLQNAIDQLAEKMMEKYNKQQAIVYNTIQLYRTDRLAYLYRSFDQAKEKGFKPGVKLVRGAYMEKERERALQKNYPSPIQPDWASTNRDYDKALEFCIDHIDDIAVCAGTHNEASSMLLVQLMEEKQIAPNHQHIWFSQLLGMSDHITYNLAKAGYNVCKYVPYGPVREVLPYLFRRAKENTSVKGQTGRELSLIIKEKERRKSGYKLN